MTDTQPRDSKQLAKGNELDLGIAIPDVLFESRNLGVVNAQSSDPAWIEARLRSLSPSGGEASARFIASSSAEALLIWAQCTFPLGTGKSV